MVSRRPNSKDTVSDKNPNTQISSILKKFAEINIREWTFKGVKKGIHPRDFGQNL